MIFFWNRHEVYRGYSLEEFNNTLDKLVANGIKYRCLIGYPPYGLLPSKYFAKYRVHIHKKDLDRITMLQKIGGEIR